MIRTLTRLGACCVLGLGFLSLEAPVWAQDVDAESESVTECASVLREHIHRTYPAADRIEWTMPTVTSEDSDFGERLVGSGTYKGKSGRRRTISFECTFDPFHKEVVKATWQSSFESGKTHVALDTTDEDIVRPSDVADVCDEAIDAELRSKWPRYRQFELVEETVTRSVAGKTFAIQGQGRYQGGPGGWARFRFKCTTDGETAKLDFRRLGEESG